MTNVIHMPLKRKVRNGFLGTMLALTSLSIVALPTLGCPAINQNTVATLTTTLTDAVVNVANIEGDPVLAAALKKDGEAAANAVLNWKNGSPVDMAIEALGILQDDLGLIPGTSQYAPLIDIAIGATQTILALIPPAQVTPAVTAKLARHHVRTVFLGHEPPKTAGQFKAQWDAALKAHPNLPSTLAIK